MKKKKTLKIILIIGGLLLSPILLLILGWLLFALVMGFVINKDVVENKHEIFSYVREQNASAESVCIDKTTAFFYDSNGFFRQGYYSSSDDTYWLVEADGYTETAACIQELTEKDARRYWKGMRTEERYYTEKICDNWYYFRAYNYTN